MFILDKIFKLMVKYVNRIKKNLFCSEKQTVDMSYQYE